jgi:hypothetical protein
MTNVGDVDQEFYVFPSQLELAKRIRKHTGLEQARKMILTAAQCRC